MMTDAYSSLLTAGTSSLVAVLGLILGCYFIILFFFGLMLYFFTGSKPGESLLARLMRVGMRLYVQVWMFISAFLVFTGVTYLIRALLVTLFPTSSPYSATQYFGAAKATPNTDLQNGVVYLGLGVVLFAVHMVLSMVMESRAEKMKSMIYKMFNFAGIVAASLIFFVSTLSLVSGALTSLSGNSSITLDMPGMISAFVGSALLWAYFLIKSLISLRAEDGEKGSAKHK